jgi:hypothetical protein
MLVEERRPVSTTRRAVFATTMALGALAALPATAAPDLATELQLLRIAQDRLNQHTAANPAPDALWVEWEERHLSLMRRIEALPVTPANAPIKAKAVFDIIDGDLSALNEQNTTLERLLIQVIRALAVN